MTQAAISTPAKASAAAKTATIYRMVMPNHTCPYGLKALDLLKQMLEIHPKRRITVEKALQHPFLESLHSPDDEPVNTTGKAREEIIERISQYCVVLCDSSQ